MNDSGDDSDGQGTWNAAVGMKRKPNSVQSKQQNARSKQKNLFASNAPKE